MKSGDYIRSDVGMILDTSVPLKANFMSFFLYNSH